MKIIRGRNRKGKSVYCMKGKGRVVEEVEEVAIDSSGGDGGKGK